MYTFRQLHVHCVCACDSFSMYIMIYILTCWVGIPQLDGRVSTTWSNSEPKMKTKQKHTKIICQHLLSPKWSKSKQPTTNLYMCMIVAWRAMSLARGNTCTHDMYIYILGRVCVYIYQVHPFYLQKLMCNCKHTHTHTHTPPPPSRHHTHTHIHTHTQLSMSGCV